eukprot:SAG31_NODE_5918_length_2256_cov_2.629578_2_plen_116_part_00
MHLVVCSGASESIERAQIVPQRLIDHPAHSVESVRLHCHRQHSRAPWDWNVAACQTLAAMQEGKGGRLLAQPNLKLPEAIEDQNIEPPSNIRRTSQDMQRPTLMGAYHRTGSNRH